MKLVAQWAAAAAAMLTFAAWAQPASAVVHVGYLLQNGAADPQPLSGDVLGDTLAPVTFAGSNALATGTTTVKAEHGALSAFAQVSGRALIGSSLLYEDTITVVSDALPVGTPVDFTLRLSLDYSLSCGSDPSTSGAGVDAVLSLEGNSTQFQAYCFDGVTIDNTQRIVTFNVGDVVGLTAQLNITAGAGNCCEDGAATADAFHTARLFLDPLGRGYSYSAESGAPYFSPQAVPEPASWALMIAGCGLAGAALRRRRLGAA